MTKSVLKLDDTMFDMIAELASRFNKKAEDIFKIVNSPFGYTEQVIINTETTEFDEIYIPGLVRFTLNKASYGKYRVDKATKAENERMGREEQSGSGSKFKSDELLPLEEAELKKIAESMENKESKPKMDNGFLGVNSLF